MLVIRHDALVASVAPDDKQTLFLIAAFSSLDQLFHVFFLTRKENNTIVYEIIINQNHQNILDTAIEFLYI